MRAKCPECGAFAAFKKVGEFRHQCPLCNSLVKNEELTEEIEEDDGA